LKTASRSPCHGVAVDSAPSASMLEIVDLLSWQYRRKPVFPSDCVPARIAGGVRESNPSRVVLPKFKVVVLFSQPTNGLAGGLSENNPPAHRHVRCRAVSSLAWHGVQRPDFAPADHPAGIVQRTYQRSAAVCTGASQSFSRSASRAVTVSEQPAMSREVQ
jgi:hypothetical protein